MFLFSTPVMLEDSWKEGQQHVNWADRHRENQFWQNKGAYLTLSEPIKANNNTLEPQQTMETTSDD